MQDKVSTFNVIMPDGYRITGVPVGTTKAEIQQKYDAYKLKNTSFSDALAQGASGSASSATSFIKDVIPGMAAHVAATLGVPGAQEYQEKQVQDIKNRNNNLGKEVDLSGKFSVTDLSQISDIYHKQGIGPALKATELLFGQGLGGQGPQILSQIIARTGGGIIGGLIGGAGGTAVEPGIGTAAGTAVGVGLGQQIGGTMAAGVFNTGDLYAGIAQEDVDPFEHPYLVTAAAAAISSLDALSLEKFINIYGGKTAAAKAAGSFIGKALKAGVVGGAVEGSTEKVQGLLQSFVNSSLSGKPMNWSESNTDAALGVALGSLGGIGAHTMGHVFNKDRINQETQEELQNTTNKLPEDELPTEEVSSAPPPIETTKADTTKEKPVPPSKETANSIFEQAFKDNQTSAQEDLTPVAPSQDPSTPISPEINADKPTLHPVKPVDVSSKPSKTDLKQVSTPVPTIDLTTGQNPVKSNDIILDKPKEFSFKPLKSEDVAVASPNNPQGFKLNTNATNSRQMQYAKAAGDLANLFGLNVPLDVVFKSGDDSKFLGELDPITLNKVSNAKRKLGVKNEKGEITDASGGLYTDKKGFTRGIIVLDEKGKSDQEVVKDISHEISHGITKGLIQSNPVLLNMALADYNKWARKANKKGLTAKQFNSRIGSFVFDKEGKVQKPSSTNIKKGVNIVQTPTENSNFDEYLMSFDEYMAEGVARFIQTNAEPINLLEKYFKWVASVYRKFATYMKGKDYYPNNTIDEICQKLIDQAKGRSIANQMVTKGPTDSLNDLRAYHASPHKIEGNFSLDYVNTGEGTQNEGWGLYFASIKDVAAWYHDMFQKGDRAKDKLKVRAGTSSVEMDGRNMTGVLEELPVWSFLSKEEQNNLKAFYTDQYYNKVGKEEFVHINTEAVKKGRELAKTLGLTSELTPGKKPHLYSVDINIDENRMLSWDEPLSEQPQFVKDVIKKLYTDKYGKYDSSKDHMFSGKEVYRGLSKFIDNLGKFGTPEYYKSISLFLNNLGIPGIKYLDQDSRSAEDGIKTHNYVIFNDAAIQIRNVFDNQEDFMLSDKRKAPKTSEVKEDPTKYKYVNKPFAIEHEEGFKSITGDEDGSFYTFDKQGNKTGTLTYTKENGVINIDNIQLEQNGQRHRQDTMYALLDVFNTTYSKEQRTVSSEIKPYQTAYNNIQNKAKVETKVSETPVLKQPDITDVKRIPLFEKQVLPKMSTKLQNLFKTLPKGITEQVKIIGSYLGDSTSFTAAMRMAISNPEAYGLTKQDIKTLYNNKDVIAQFINKEFRQGTDAPYILNQRPEDLIPDAYDSYLQSKQLGTGEYNTDFSDEVKRVFDKLSNNVLNTRKELNSNGVTKLNDIFYVPTKFEQVDIGFLGNTSFASLERDERLVDSKRAQIFDDAQKVEIQAGNIGPMSSVMKYILPSVDWARKSPLVAKIQNLAIGRRENMLRLQNTFMNQVTPLITKYRDNRAKFNAMVGTLESNKLNGFKGFLDEEGFFHYKDKNGIERRIADKEVSQDIVKIQNVFKQLLQEKERVALGNRETQEIFRKVGLSYNPTVSEVENVINKHGNKLDKGQVQALQSIADYMKLMKQLRQRDYVPFSRKGTHGISIKRIGEDGKKELVSFPTYNKDKKGNPIKDMDWHNAQEEIKKYQSDSSYEISSEFELTKDKLLQSISNKEATVDVVEQLIDIISGDSRVVEGGELDTSPAWKALGEILSNDIMKKGYNAAMKESRNIGGYRKDWMNVVPTHLQGAAFALSNQKFAPLIQHALRASQLGSSTKVEREFAAKYAKSLLTIDPDWMNTLKKLQFFHVLGFNVSSAMVQLTSFTHMMPSTLTLATANPLRSYKIMAKATHETSRFISIGEDKLYDLSPENMRKQGKEMNWSDDKINFMIKVVLDGYVAQTQSIESIGSEIRDATTVKGRALSIADNATKFAGWGLRATEEMSRVAQAAAMYDALEDPNGLNRFHNMIFKDSEQYRQHLKENGIVGSDKAYLMKEGVNLALALFGKEGRAQFQNNAMQFVFPFSTYPWQIFLNFYRMATKLGPVGKLAAFQAGVGMVFWAGLMGIPGAFLLRTLMELLMSEAFKEEVDMDSYMLKLEEELLQKHQVGLSDIVSVLHRGVPSSGMVFGLGLDLNERTMGQTPADPLIKDLSKAAMSGKMPDTFTQNSLGVLGGSIALMPINMVKKYGDTGGDILKTMMVGMPTALKNLISSVVVEPSEGKAMLGTQILTQQEARRPLQVFAGSLGFKGWEEGVQEERARASYLVEHRVDLFKTSETNKLQRAYINYLKNQNDLDAKQNFDKAQQRFVKFMVEKGFDGLAISQSIQLALKKAAEDFVSQTDRQASESFKLKKAGKAVRDDILPFLPTLGGNN